MITNLEETNMKKNEKKEFIVSVVIHTTQTVKEKHNRTFAFMKQ